VSAVGGVVGVLALGVGLGLQYSAVTSVIGSVIAAVVLGYPAAPSARRPMAVAVLALAWLVGDGAAIGHSISTTPPKGLADWAGIALWVGVGALVGYVVPAAAGALVGRSVTRGTGWLSAGAVALSVAGALVVLSPFVADAVAKVAAR
jgi:hypothetical protein